MYKWLNSIAAASGQCWVAADTRVERDNCLVFPVSAMQTLDRRISASSDQLDTLKKQKQRQRPFRTRSSSRLSYERKFDTPPTPEVRHVSEVL